MSYMKVVAFTHSPDAATSLYGFASMYLLGFLWAAPGGTGCALPAYLSREKLTEFFYPISAAIIGWLIRDMLSGFSHHLRTDGAGSLFPPIWPSWYWPPFAGSFDMGTRLGLYICGGWWVGMIPAGARVRLAHEPPRGDGWAGCIGLVAGILIFCVRNGLGGVAFATLCTGLWVAAASRWPRPSSIWAFTPDWLTNWHSVMEQTDGLFYGLGSGCRHGIDPAPGAARERRSSRPPLD